MGGWIGVGISLLAAVLFYRGGSNTWMVLALINALVSFWSFGIMHNYAHSARRGKIDRLRENLALEGRIDESADERLRALENGIDPSAAPNWLATTNLVSFVLGLLLLIFSIIR
ncbi:MAG: hypothetical protein ACC742_15860 [Thermoanaerobaculales bacterium]